MDLRSSLSVLMPELRAYAMSICANRADADDLVGDAIERALTARKHPNDIQGIRPWMFRIIRNLNIDGFRKQKVRMEYSEVQSRVSDEQVLGGSDALDDVLTRMAFEKLKPGEREILYLVDVTGMKYAEAAAVMGVPVGTVMSRVSRARQAFLALIDDSNVTPIKTEKKVRG